MLEDLQRRHKSVLVSYYVVADGTICRAAFGMWPFLMATGGIACSRSFTRRSESLSMNKSYLIQLAVFVVALVALNYFFQWHISIIGSLVLTLGLNFVLRLFQTND